MLLIGLSELALSHQCLTGLYFRCPVVQDATSPLGANQMPVSSPFSRPSPAVGVLLRNHSAGDGRGKVESEFSGLALKVVKGSFFEELFVGLLAGFDVSLCHT